MTFQHSNDANVSAETLLKVWESGEHRLPYERALVALRAVYSETSMDDLARLSIGHRDALLMTCYAHLFGSQLEGIVTCPHCSELCEVAFNVTDVERPASTDQSNERTLDAAGYLVTYRLPTSIDLAAIADPMLTADAQKQLFASCILEARYDTVAVIAEELPPPVVDAVVADIARADPQADVQMSLVCPSCGHAWFVTFDIVSFFWTELTAWAKRTINEVHTLARAYGWTEQAILAMHPLRRQRYLELV